MNIRKVITATMTAAAGIMVTLSGIMKFVKPPDMVDKLTAAWVIDYISVLACMEFAFMALFLFPKTMRIGFVLLSCYFSGAVATDLSHGFNVVGAAVILALIWIAAFLRDSDLFLFSAKRKVKLA